MPQADRGTVSLEVDTPSCERTTCNIPHTPPDADTEGRESRHCFALITTDALCCTIRTCATELRVVNPTPASFRLYSPTTFRFEESVLLLAANHGEETIIGASLSAVGPLLRLRHRLYVATTRASECWFPSSGRCY